jgi:hypothetical protein
MSCLRRFVFAAIAALASAALHAEVPPPAPAVVISSADGAQASVRIEGGHVGIIRGTRAGFDADAVHLVGEARGDKRYYFRMPAREAVFEVKFGEDGFKLRTPAGKLLWKVKIAADKIKVSDNEENANAWALKTDYADKAKLVDPAGKEAGEVKFGATGGKAKLKDAAGATRFVIESGKPCAACAVLLADGVPEEARWVILAELLARGS